ncbi:hypothetical protein OA253_05525, partial [Alphaproteobacteria bacterium]|nr:hypothetical protein [Alphaproteobacteria bacterium]
MDQIIFINPPMHVKKNDTYTTGIVFMPFVLAEAVGIANFFKIENRVLDCFGENPKKTNLNSELNDIIIGISEKEIVRNLKKFSKNKNTLFVIFANHMSNHWSVKNLCKICKSFDGKNQIMLLENSEAVTSYSIRSVLHEFQNLGVTYFCDYDVEENFVKFIKNNFNIKEIFKMKFKYKGDVLEDSSNTKSYVPSWEAFPLKNYWGLNFGHGPVSSSKYLPLLTSKGCPYPCQFCVMPELSQRRWRYRS